MLLLGLTENMLRADISPLDAALGLVRLRKLKPAFKKNTPSRLKFHKDLDVKYSDMARDPDEIQFKPLPRDFKPPLLKLGGPWAGGTLRRKSTATMAAEHVLLDTSLLVAATVEEHPRHAASKTYVEGLATTGTSLR